MAIARVVRSALKDQVYTMLRGEIATGALAEGARLDSIRKLAARFDTSVRTVHLALSALEAEGRLIKKHGSGTFIAKYDPELTIADTVVLCMEITGHVFADLCRMLQHDLGVHEQIPMCLDVAHPDFARLLRRASFSEAGFFVVHGTQYFPFALLQDKPFASKTVIGILDWETDLLADRAHRVIVDHTAGGRLVAAHFRAGGHRRVMLAGHGQMLWFAQSTGWKFPNNGQGFLKAWGESGDSVDCCQALEGVDSVEGKAADDLLAVLNRLAGPTAIFALMDSNGAWIQNVLMARAPELMDRVEIVGYGNTPWSQAAKPSFSTVDWNLGSVVKETSAIINAVQAGQVAEPKVVRVEPVLVKR